MAITRQDAAPVPFVRGLPPDDKSIIIYLVSEMEKLQNTLGTLVNLVVQVAISEPPQPLTGMLRWAKAPWDPLGTGDGLVQWNGTIWVAVGGGTSGTQGQMGPPGIDGSDGYQGDIGPIGLQGAAGAPGPTGERGVPGSQGDDGFDGPMGPPGNTGAAGSSGSSGSDGQQGPPGLEGLDGADGPPGLTGLTGLPGQQGPPGFQGDEGEQGPYGPPGNIGPTGSQGLTGIDGLLGRPGYDGNDGDMGPPGYTGATGPQGPAGGAGNVGTAILDFGTFPGSNVAYVDVVTAGIISTSTLNAWIRPTASADHTDTDHVAAPMRVSAVFVSNDNIRIYGINTNDLVPPLEPQPPRGDKVLASTTRKTEYMTRQPSPMFVGQFNVSWTWS